jgi:hypothetical protein
MLNQRWAAGRRRLVFAPAGSMFEWAYFSQGRRVLPLNMESLRFHGHLNAPLQERCFYIRQAATSRPAKAGAAHVR